MPDWYNLMKLKQEILDEIGALPVNQAAVYIPVPYKQSYSFDTPNVMLKRKKAKKSSSFKQGMKALKIADMDNEKNDKETSIEKLKGEHVMNYAKKFLEEQQKSLLKR